MQVINNSLTTLSRCVVRALFFYTCGTMKVMILFIIEPLIMKSETQRIEPIWQRTAFMFTMFMGLWFDGWFS